MEILQTIWTALISENDKLTMVISIPLSFLEAYISTLIFTTFLNIKSTKSQNLIYVLTFSVIALLSLFFIPTPYNTFINLITCPILVYFIFKTTILKSILAEIIPYIIFIVFGSISLNMCTAFLNITSEAFSKIPIVKFLGSSLLYTLVFLIYQIFNKLFINITISDRLKKKDTILLIINVVLGIIAIAMQSYVVNLYAHYIPLTITLISIFILLVYFSLSMYSLVRTSKLEITTERLEEEQLYNKTLNILYDNIRGFKHDFGNIVQSIGGYIGTNDVNGLKEYYSDLMEDCKKLNNLSILNPELINNPAIYSLLTSKYHKAEELGIKMNFEIFLDLSNLNIKIYELSRILGILLDNAIEASSTCKEKEINVIIRKDNKVNRQLFIIENTYENKDINTDKIFEKGYTSKSDDGKSHGLGLWEVRQILRKNNNLNLYTSKTDKFFSQQLEIYC